MKRKIILDLCGGTGSWSKPYEDAGYKVYIVTMPFFDLLETEFTNEYIYFKGGASNNLVVKKSQVHGILAAPTCTMFSMARTVAKTPRDLKGAMKLVEMCLRIVWEVQYSGKRLSFWALENPKARLRWFLGVPTMTFNPYDYGDPHRKPTDIWGNFNTKLRKNVVALNEKQRKQSQLNSQEMTPLPVGYICPPDFNKRAAQRSITPQGFANAFFKANR